VEPRRHRIHRRPSHHTLTRVGGRKEDPVTVPWIKRFGTPKPVIAMLHFPALPGRPQHDRARGRAHLLDVVGRDLEVLQTAGVDGVLFCNEADIPYQLAVGVEIPSAMAAVIGELRSTIRVPFGVNILWDAKASLALARATGASFIREVLTGVYESDLGMIAPAIGDLAGYRTAIGADDVAFFDNISPEFSSAVGGRGIADRARGAAFLGMDAILISGPAAGVAFAMSDLRAAHEAVPDVPVIANTGVRADRVAEIFAVADGAIVGTSLKIDGSTWNPVDPDRAMRLMDAARAAR
jgi:membrane complex biogenesis BtpA family protein